MEEPALINMEVSNCLICSSNSQFTNLKTKYTDFVMNYFISYADKKLFIGRKSFDFCFSCVDLLDELQQLKAGLDFILKSIKEKEDEIKRKIANASKISNDLVIKKFRDIATKDLSPRIEMFKNNALCEEIPLVSFLPVKQEHEQHIENIPIISVSSLPTVKLEESTFCENVPLISSQTDVKLEPTDDEVRDIVFNQSDLLSTTPFQPSFSGGGEDEEDKLMESNVSCFENNPTIICSTSNAFGEVEVETPSTVGQEEYIQSGSSYVQSYEVEDESVFQFESWAATKVEDDENDTFEIIPPEMPPINDVGEVDIMMRRSDNDIGTQMKKIVATIVRPNPKLKVWTKPPLNYPQLCILAIMSKDNMLMMIPDIFVFISENFPYFMLETEVWKSEIKSDLLSDFFLQYKRDLNKKGELSIPSKITIMYSVSDYHIKSLRLEMIEILCTKDFSSSMAYPERLCYFQSVLKRKISVMSLHSSAKRKKLEVIELEREVVDIKPKVPSKQSDKKRGMKKKQITSTIRSTTPGVITTTEVYPPTPLSFKHLSVVAIMNTSCKLASAPDILQFIIENYPYFGNMSTSQITPYKRILRTVLQQSQFALHAYWNDVTVDNSDSISQFEDTESYKMIYTVNDSCTTKDCIQFIVSNLRSRKNIVAMKFPDRIEGFVQNVLRKVLVPNFAQYRRKFAWENSNR